MYDTYEINIPPLSKLNIVCLCSYSESLNPGEVILMDKMDDIIHVNKIFFLFHPAFPHEHVQESLP